MALLELVPRLLGLLIAAHAITVVISSVDVGLDSYEDMLMQNLYKRLSQIDTSLFDDASHDNEMIDYNDLPAEYQSQNDREMQATEIRDSEKIEHSSNAGSHGPIHMSGGSGEAKQHLKPDGSQDNIPKGMTAVKSDESLPFYCHPANPCPKGVNESEGCQNDIEDTAEAQKQWITNMQLRGACACDREHMFNCPDASPTLGSAASKAELDNVVSSYNKVDNPHWGGEKRLTLVAKKSPRVKRSVTGAQEVVPEAVASLEAHNKNPYLQGERLRTVAKKG